MNIEIVLIMVPFLIGIFAYKIVLRSEERTNKEKFNLYLKSLEETKKGEL